jgi:hypothetical protein
MLAALALINAIIIGGLVATSGGPSTEAAALEQQNQPAQVVVQTAEPSLHNTDTITQ